MKLFYYGHSCFSVQLSHRCSGVRLLFDPFFSHNPKAQENHFTAETPEADYVLVSHGHFDHVGDTVEIVQKTGAIVLAGYEVCEWLHKHGVEDRQLHRMNLGGCVRLPFGSVQMVRADHSSTLPDGSSGGSAGGFVVRSLDGAFYYSGDTALHMDMQLIPRGGPLRFAVLSLGDTFTMGPEDALEAARFVQCDEVVGVHFDTWPPISIDQEGVRLLFENGGKKLHLPYPGMEIGF